MKQMITCPMCDSIMITEWGSPHYYSCIKKCYKNPSHWIELHSFNSTDEIDRIDFRVSSSLDEGTIWAKWHFPTRTFEIGNATKSYKLPWFEPDISNYNSLLDKVKTYITFS